MRSEAGLAAVAVWRRLSARRGALAATGAVVLAAAFFAVRVAVAWEASLPRAAQDDLRALPDAAVVALNSADVGAPACGPGQAALPPAARSAAAAGGFGVDAITTSGSLAPVGLSAAAPDSLIKAYCAPTIRDHATLTAGSWPGAPVPGGPIPVAMPSDTLAALKLHVGSHFTVAATASHVRADLLVTGVFERSLNPAGWWDWDEVTAGSGTVSGSGAVAGSGVRIIGSYTVYDPVVVDSSAFGAGKLSADSSTLVILPPTGNGSAADLTALSAQATAITDTLAKDNAPFYALSGALVGDLNALDAGVATAHAQLLAACLLLGAVTAAGLVAATGLLVGIGAGQSALGRARGAGRRHLLLAQWPESLVLCAAAALAVPIGTATAHVTASAAWAGAAAVAALAIAVLCARALRQELPAEVAAARGRQAPLAYGLRLGADVALAALAALALWQASGNPLAGRGPSGLVGTDLIVAAAPALAVAAVAALAGRLVPAVARLAERGASGARRLSTVFAFWQVGRTPLGYVLPALVSVAAVAGGTFAIAQNASWQRSTRDQGAYSVGAQVAVTTPWSQSIGASEAVTHAPGVLAATAVERLPGSQGTSLLALNSATAADTVLMRSDLGQAPAAQLWHQVGAGASTGLAIPGRPTRLSVTAQLSVTSLRHANAIPIDPVNVVATVQDASGLIYTVSLGHIAADGVVHTLAGSLSASGTPNYPLSLLRFDLSYLEPPAVDANGLLSVLALAAGGDGAATSFATGDRLVTWAANSSSSATDPCAGSADGSHGPGDTPNPAPQTMGTKQIAGGGMALAFSTGAGLNWNATGPCSPIPASLSLSAGVGKSPVNALATSAYLRSTGTSVGATVPITVNGALIPAHIIASVSAFPTLPATGPGGLIVDLPALAAETVEQGSTLWPPTEWWLRTRDAAAPPDLPAGSSAVTAVGLADSLEQDPLSAIAPGILDLGAADLVLLAALALAACLAAAGRRQAAHDPVLAALGAGRRERVAIRLLLNLVIVAPAALLGWGLGLLVARQLVPVFVVTPGGTAPLPPVLFTTRPGWSAAAVLVLLAIGITTAIDVRRTRNE